MLGLTDGLTGFELCGWDPARTHLHAHHRRRCSVLWSRQRGSGIQRTTSGTFVTIASGEDASCAVSLNGQITCWGDDSANQVSGALMGGDCP